MTRRTSGGQSTGQRVLREVRGYAEALAIAYAVITFVFTTVGVVGASMLPTLDGGPGQSRLAESLLTGDRVFVPKYETWLRRMGLMDGYQRGDIVVLREPTASPGYLANVENGCLDLIIFNQCRPFFIKRIVGEPGDEISIDAGQVIVNGVRMSQEFITSPGTVAIEDISFPVVMLEDGAVTALQVGFLTTASGIPVPILPAEDILVGFLPVTDPRVEFYYGQLLGAIVLPEDAPDGVPLLAGVLVPADHYFIMGDNRSRGGSQDSRHSGFIPAGEIAGRAAAVIWPPLRAGEWNWRLLSTPAGFGELR